LTAPLPHFKGRAAQQRNETAARLVQLDRIGQRTEEQDAEAERLRRELRAPAA
jgi:hypothetical protein